MPYFKYNNLILVVSSALVIKLLIFCGFNEGSLYYVYKTIKYYVSIVF